MNATLQNLTYSYDLNANVASIVDALAGGSQTQSFGYDSQDRLTSAAAASGSGGIYSQSYSYDSYGRLLNGPLGSSYLYGDGNHKHAVTAVGSNSFGYDLNGNQTSRTENGSVYAQNYDAENRLTSVTNATAANFAYDGDNQRVKGEVNGEQTIYVGNHYEETKTLCRGQTTPGSTNWIDYTYGGGIYVDVDTSACGLTTTPLYLTSLGGDSSHYVTAGATSIYVPTATGFRVYVRNANGSTLTAAFASARNWHINWIATARQNTTTELCSGRTVPQNTNWQVHNSNGIYVDIDTSACGFTVTPEYVTSLGGNGSHWATRGVTSIYSPTPTGFRVYVSYDFGSITPAQANTSGWHVNWLATPLNLSNSSFCTGQTAAGSTNWQVYNSDSVYVDVTTASCGYGTTPRYFTSLGGYGSHRVVFGANAIYVPTATGFRVYVNFVGITPAQAISWGWQINWLAVAGNETVVRKYYYAGSQRVAMREKGNLRWLLSDHLGGTAVTATGTTESGEVRYYPFGADRYTSGTTPTSFKYTGQRQESGIGLYYYGARWYDPALGRFTQPDTLVPNPGDAKSFDRYAYVLNNPLKYQDPTGRIAVCFQGGDFNDDVDAPPQGSVFLQLCQQTLQNGGYREDIHGPIYYRTNGSGAIEATYREILARKRAYPDEPVLILGYSWGGAAALDLATLLSSQIETPWGSVASGRPNIEVDLLFLVDPEQDFRGPVGQWVGSLVGQRDGRSRPSPTEVSSNVKSAISLFAEQADSYVIPQLGVPAYEWTWANGLNEVRGALNVGLSETEGEPVNHYSITQNERTAQSMQSSIFGALYGYPFDY